MGAKRFFNKFLLGGGSLIEGHINDALVKKNKTGKSFRECLRDSINETLHEDMPGTSHLYQRGKSDGKKCGMAEQAQRDETKFKSQHETHEKDRAEWEYQKNQYENLLDNLE